MIFVVWAGLCWIYLLCSPAEWIWIGGRPVELSAEAHNRSGLIVANSPREGGSRLANKL